MGRGMGSLEWLYSGAWWLSAGWGVGGGDELLPIRIDRGQ